MTNEMVKQHMIYLALGTNLENREENLREAPQWLSPQVEVTVLTWLYETALAYVLDQPIPCYPPLTIASVMRAI